VPTGEPPVFLPCDEVLLAVGQSNAFPFIEAELGIKMTDRGLPLLDPVTLQSSLPQVFFGGDSAFGPKTSSPLSPTATRRPSPSTSSARGKICTNGRRRTPTWSARRWAAGVDLR
jgi:NADPH-dependent glutamate synthase beta subunit-like oxidoreductase